MGRQGTTFKPDAGRIPVRSSGLGRRYAALWPGSIPKRLRSFRPQSVSRPQRIFSFSTVDLALQPFAVGTQDLPAATQPRTLREPGRISGSRSFTRGCSCLAYPVITHIFLSKEVARANNFKSSIYDNLTACESADDFHRPVLGLSPSLASPAAGGSIVVTAIKKHETSRLQLEPSATAPLNTPRR